MPWLDEALDRLTRQPLCGYYPGMPAAAEPTALAAMALIAHGRSAAARAGLAWLADLQSPSGSIGVDASHPAPCWPTGWAVLAWHTAATASRASKGKTAPEIRPASAWLDAQERAVAWLLATKGVAEESTEAVGHDATLQAWPWIEGTHSWVEPSAMGLLALKAVGHAAHPRSREAVRLLLDRMVPTGGWNQGNKIILNRVLRPHIEPTGLALASLFGELESPEPIGMSLGYLRTAISRPVAPASLSYGLIGLAAHGRSLPEADRWLAAACARTLQREASPYHLALLALASLGRNCPWFLPPVHPQDKG
jgi:hypothetical protein